MKTLLRTLIVLDPLFWLISIVVLIFEEERFKENYSTLFNSFESFEISISLPVTVIFIALIIVPPIMLFFFTRFSREVFTAVIFSGFFYSLFPKFFTPIIGYPLGNIVYNISFLNAGILIGLIWFSPAKRYYLDKNKFQNSEDSYTHIIIISIVVLLLLFVLTEWKMILEMETLQDIGIFLLKYWIGPAIAFGLFTAFTSMFQKNIPENLEDDFEYFFGNVKDKDWENLKPRVSGTSVCPTCDGHGKVRSQSGFYTIEKKCPRCEGSGKKD